MKTIRFLPLVFVLVSRLPAADETVTGNLTVTGMIGSVGTIETDSNTVTFGTQGASFGAQFLYQDSDADTFIFQTNRNPASWLWRHNTVIPAMRLNSLHDLVLYQADGLTAGITLAPASNRLSLGTATLTGSGTTITANGALSFAGDITNTSATAKAAIGAAPSGTTTLTLQRAAGASTDGNLVFGDGVQWTRLNSNASNAAYNPMVAAGDHSYIFSNGASGTGALVIAPWSSSTSAGMRMTSSGSVGIGKTPSTKLHVYGGSIFNQTAAGLAYYFGGNADGATNAKYSAIGMGSGGHITFNSATDALAQTEYARFTAAGRLGIGTTAPATNLHLKTPSTGHTYARLESVDGGNFIQFQRGATVYNSLVSPYVTPGDFAILDNVNNAARLYINPAGNVGIGTTTPGATLEVNGTSLFDSTATFAVGGYALFHTAKDGGATGGIVAESGKGLYLGANNSLSTGMFIDGAGNVGIGTTSPDAKLHVNGMALFGPYPGVVHRASGDLDTNGAAYLSWQDNSGGPYLERGWIGFGKGNASIGLQNNAGPIELITPGGTGLFVGTSSNVGVGTVNPKEALHLFKSGVGSGDNQLLKLHYDMNSGGGTYIGFTQTSAANAYSKALFGYQATGGSYGSNGDFIFAINSNGTDSPVTSSDTKVIIKGSGNVGIGTTSPASPLQVVGNFGIAPSGTTPEFYPGSIHISQQLASGQSISMSKPGYYPWSIGWVYNTTTFAIGTSQGTDSDFTSPQFVINTSGNVGIGTTAPTHKLAVNGTIRAKEVIVDTGWADYVFEEDYRLAPLAEVESHIKAKKHLPGIPSAAEVAEHGVSMGDMQAKLLSKVEELTLHLIAQQKELAALRSEVAELKASSKP